jgi:hypothetical protein
MPKYSVSDAARRAKIARSTMYEKYINTGTISVEKVSINGVERSVIDSAEWDRVFGAQSGDYIMRTRSDGPSADINTAISGVKTDTSDIVVQLLREQLHKAEEREKRLLDQVDRFLRQIEHKPAPAPVMQTEPVIQPVQESTDELSPAVKRYLRFEELLKKKYDENDAANKAV